MEKCQNSCLLAWQVAENHWIGDLTSHQQTEKRWLWLALLLVILAAVLIGTGQLLVGLRRR